MVGLPDNPVVNLSEYELSHLAAHLEEARRVEDLHRVLALETSERRNAWYEAKGTWGDVRGYTSDVMRAWQLAQKEYNPADAVHAGRSVSLQCRYALVTTSLNSVAASIPPVFLALLVEKRIWTPTQGWAYAERMPDPAQQAQALSELASHLSEPLLQEALAIAQQIEQASERANALAGLAPHLPVKLLKDALGIARTIEPEPERANALVGLVPYLSEKLLEETLAATRTFEDMIVRGKVLVELVPRLAESCHPQAALLKDNLSRNILPAARQALATILATDGDDYWKAQALAAMAQRLPKDLKMEALKEALKATDRVGHRDWPSLEYLRAQALLELVPQLSQELMKEALDVAFHIWPDDQSRASAFIGLVPYLPQELLTSAGMADSIGDEVARSKVMIAIEKRSSQEKKWADLMSFPELLSYDALAVGDKDDRAKTLTCLAPYLPKTMLSEVLVAIRAIDNEESRTQAMVDIASILPQELLVDMVATSQDIQGEYNRAKALAAMVPYLPKAMLAQVLKAVCAISDDNVVNNVLFVLEPYLPEELLREALLLAVVRPVGWSLEHIVLHLPEELKEVMLQEAMTAVLAITDGHTRARALARLVPYLPGPLVRQVPAAIRTLEAKSEVLEKLASRLAELGFSHEALAAAREIQDKKDLANAANAMIAVAPYLPEELLEPALAMVQMIRDEHWERAKGEEAMAGLASRLAELSHFQEALAVAREIKDDFWRGSALTRMVSHLPQSLMDQVLKVAPGYGWALKELIPYLPEPLLQRTLAVAQNVPEKKYRIKVLAELASLLPHKLKQEALQVALKTVQEMEEGWEQVRALQELTPHLTEPLLRQAVAVAQEIQWVWGRAEALTCLGHFVPAPVREKTLQQALAAAREIE